MCVPIMPMVSGMLGGSSFPEEKIEKRRLSPAPCSSMQHAHPSQGAGPATPLNSSSQNNITPCPGKEVIS